MSDALGPLTFGRDAGARFLSWRPDSADERNFSEATARLIESELKTIITGEHTRACKELSTRRRALEAIARELLTHETLQRADLEAIVHRTTTREPHGSHVDDAPVAH